MKKQILTGIFALLGLLAQAQNLGTISGNIKDGGQQAVIDAASVSLLKSADSSLIKTSITDKQGNFSFDQILPGTYLVVATSIGYEKTYSPAVTVSENNPAVSTGVMQLVPSTKGLVAVTVTSKRPIIERKIDRTVVNVDAMLTAAGGTALEVMQKSPGITIDKDGNISLKGKQGVIILVDGKPSYLSGQDLVNFLSNMSASNLEQLEIMTNPPAKFDAAGNSGVINIKTKKNKQKGFNGSINTSEAVGKKFRTSNSLSLNYRNGKFNFFSNLNANYRNQVQNLSISRQYLNDDKTVNAIFNQHSEQERQRQYYALKTGVDVYLNGKTTLGAVISGAIAPSKTPGTNISYLGDPRGNVDSTVVATTIENGKWKNVGINLNMRHKFDSTGREITADADYWIYDSKNNNSILTRAFLPNGTQSTAFFIDGNLPSDVEIYSFKTDYTQMLGKKIKFETGLKTSFVQTHNRANYFNTENGQTVIDKQRTSNFNYQENLNAAYINFSTEIKKWGFQAGLRAENTNYSGRQYGNLLQADSSFRKSYVSAFPTLYVSYKANDNNQLSFSYGRRINRPDYDNLNPFINFIDIYTYEVGNPYLKPMFENKLEISHTYKSFLTTTFNYNQTRNLFGEAFEKEGNAIVIRNANFGKLQEASLSLNAQVAVRKWWQMQVYTEGNYRHVRAAFRGKPVDINFSRFAANLNNQFTIGKGWSAELSGFYVSGESENQVIINPIYQLSTALQKSVLKNKGSLKLILNDFTGPMKVSGHLEDITSANANFSQRRDSRTITLNFSYRFGKPLKSEKRKTGGASDEQNRVGGGN